MQTQKVSYKRHRFPPQTIAHDVWHLDEVVVKIAGGSYWLWCAVDQYGVVLEEILQSRRDKRAAKRLLVKLIKRWGSVAKFSPLRS
jgi:transposase-like protein